MNLTGAPAHCWLLCLLYVCSLLNVTSSPVLGGLTHIQALNGQVPAISHFLHFSFWEPVCYKVDENKPDHRFPSHSNEKRGHWVGFEPDLLSEVLPKQIQTQPPKGEDQLQDLTSDVFVYGGSHPDDSADTPPPPPPHVYNQF